MVLLDHYLINPNRPNKFSIRFDPKTLTYHAVVDKELVFSCCLCGARLGFEHGLRTPYMREDTGELFCKDCCGKEVPLYFKGLVLDRSKYDRTVFSYIPLASLKVKGSSGRGLLGVLAGLGLELLKIIH